MEGHTGANNIGASALFCASRAGHVGVVQLLLTVGASVDLATPKGVTSLYIACQGNHIKVVAVLLDAGASVDLAADGGWTPLYAASCNNSIEVVAVLLDRGASVDLATDDGWTPLHTASYKNKIEAMKQLLAAGASRDIAVQGYTPLRVAKHLKHLKLEAWPLLSQHQLMVATVTGNSEAVRQLLHSGEDPTLTVQYQQHTLSVLVFARNETTCSWAAPVCTYTLRLVERSLQWSPYDLKAHYLFPPAFRRGVRHVLGLMVALERVCHELPQHIPLPQHVWMLIIASLPRDWSIN